MMEFIIGLPGWLATMIVAAMPILEIRGALPFSVEILKLPFWVAYFFSVMGNIIPAFVLLYGLRKVSIVLERRSKLMTRFLEWWFAKATKRFKKSYDLYGSLALFFFVAIPLPVTGVWTASVAAVLFKIRPRVAIPAMACGVCVSGLIVGFLVGAIKLLV